MMRKYAKILTCIVMLTGLSLSFTSCVEEVYWWSDPPYGWDSTYFDRMLDGTWELCEVNGVPIPPGQSNYLEFYGDGRGCYYYYYSGQLLREQMAYWCEDFYGPGYNPMLYLKYEHTPPQTSAYWFSPDGYYLYLQWEDYGRPQTYIYRHTGYIY